MLGNHCNVTGLLRRLQVNIQVFKIIKWNKHGDVFKNWLCPNFLSLPKKSVLPKIWGGCSPPRPPGPYAYDFTCYLRDGFGSKNPTPTVDNFRGHPLSPRGKTSSLSMRNFSISKCDVRRWLFLNPGHQWELFITYFRVKTVKKPSVGVGWGRGTRILQLYELAATLEKFEQTHQCPGLTKNYFERLTKVPVKQKFRRYGWFTFYFLTSLKHA